MSAKVRITRARDLLGVRFRLHGRSAEQGVDCVALVAHACGISSGLPTGYALRNDEEERWVAFLSHFGRRRRGSARAGDVLFMRAGPAQFHLGLWTGEGLIHADARLGRVVERPGEPVWLVISAWVPVLKQPPFSG